MTSTPQILSARSYLKQLLREFRIPTIVYSLSSDLCYLLNYVTIKMCLGFGRKSSKASLILSTTTLLLNLWKWDTPPVDCSLNPSQRIVLIPFKILFSPNFIISLLSLIFRTHCSLLDILIPSRTTTSYLTKSLNVLWRLFKMQLHSSSFFLILSIQTTRENKLERRIKISKKSSKSLIIFLML